MVYPSPVKIAFYLDTDSLTWLAEIAIAEARKHMPHAEIWHLTTINGPTLSADKCLRMDVSGTFAYRQAIISAGVEGDCLFLDVDVMLRADVSYVFDRGFDVAVTTDMRPGAPGIKYNGGVIFSRKPEYWLSIAEAGKNMDFYKVPGDWEPIERARGAVADSGRFNVLVLPGEVYNYIPCSQTDIAGKLIHYRGKRKEWLKQESIEHDGVAYAKPVFVSALNTPTDVMLAQAEENLKRDLPMFHEAAQNTDVAIVVAGGPSLNDTLLSLVFMAARKNAFVFALNGAHDWLLDRGIVPDYHVLLDARPGNACFVTRPHKDCTYLIAAQCHAKVFDALESYNVVQWIACFNHGEDELAAKFPGKPFMTIGGGATVGLKALNLCYLAGFRNIHLFGFDSCYKGEENHAYRQKLNDGEERITVLLDGEKFECAPWMAKQANEFKEQAKQLTALGVRLHVHGSGLIPRIAEKLRGN